MHPMTLSKKVVWKFRPWELASGCPVFAPSQTLCPSLHPQLLQTGFKHGLQVQMVGRQYFPFIRDIRPQTFHSQTLSRTVLQCKACKPRSKFLCFSFFMPKTTINFHTATEKWTTILKVKFQRTHSYTLFSVKIGCIKCRCNHVVILGHI